MNSLLENKTFYQNVYVCNNKEREGGERNIKGRKE